MPRGLSQDEARAVQTSPDGLVARARKASVPEVFRATMRASNEPLGALVTRAVVLLHERRIAFRGNLRTRSNGSIELKRSVPDWFGVDDLVARASGPRGESCRVSARL